MTSPRQPITRRKCYYGCMFPRTRVRYKFSGLAGLNPCASTFFLNILQTGVFGRTATPIPTHRPYDSSITGATVRLVGANVGQINDRFARKTLYSTPAPSCFQSSKIRLMRMGLAGLNPRLCTMQTVNDHNLVRCRGTWSWSSLRWREYCPLTKSSVNDNDQKRRKRALLRCLFF